MAQTCGHTPAPSSTASQGRNPHHFPSEKIQANKGLDVQFARGCTPWLSRQLALHKLTDAQRRDLLVTNFQEEKVINKKILNNNGAFLLHAWRYAHTGHAQLLLGNSTFIASFHPLLVGSTDTYWEEQPELGSRQPSLLEPHSSASIAHQHPPHSAIASSTQHQLLSPPSCIQS